MDKFGDWNTICLSSELNHHTMIYILTVFIEKDGEYFYLEDEMDKIDDIMRMPSYIKDDWIQYNKKELNLKLIDKHISKLRDVVDDEVIGQLLSIRRDLQIKKIL